MKQRHLYNLIIFLCLCLLSTSLYATTSFGEASQNLLGPLSGLNQIIYIMCRILGIALLLGAFVQYNTHRRNPSEVRLSQPIMMLIFGIVVFCIPWVVQYSGGAEVLTGQKTSNNPPRNTGTVPQR